MRRFATSSRIVATEEVRNKFQDGGERGGSQQVPGWWRMRSTQHVPGLWRIRRFATSSMMVANEEVQVPGWWRMRRFATSSPMMATEEVRNKFQDGGERGRSQQVQG